MTGCGPAIHLAAQDYRFKKVVLISAYTSCFACAGRFLSFLKGSRLDSFDSTNLMHKLKDRQVLMIGGRDDKTIPISNSEVRMARLIRLKSPDNGLIY